MATFIELTRFDEEKERAQIFVNVDDISIISPSTQKKNASGSLIEFNVDNAEDVTQSPSEVIQAIKNPAVVCD